MWLMFSAVADRVGYGISAYSRRLDEMSSTIDDLLVRYGKERIIDMAETIEEFREKMRRRSQELLFTVLTPEEKLKAREIIRKIPVEDRLIGLSAEEVFRAFPPEEVFRAFPPEEVFRAFPPEEIRAYLKKLPKKAAPAKKKGMKIKKSA